jgi:transposase-like protein
MKCKRDSDGRKIDHHTLQLMRQKATNAVAEGYAVKDVARIFGVSKKAVLQNTRPTPMTT